MVKHMISRRELLIRTVQLSVTSTMMVVISACNKKNNLLCIDPEELSESEIGLRRSLAYVEESKVPNKSCTHCAFFSSSSSGGCGACEMFKGGQVNPDGHCDAWSENS